MRKFRFAAALVPAALLFSQTATAQDADRSQANDRTRQSQQELSESALSLKGPDGQNALQVSKNAPRQVRAGEQFDYQITVRNVTDSPLQNVVVVEQVDGLEVRETKAPQQSQNQQGENRQGQDRNRQSGNRNQDGNQSRQQGNRDQNSNSQNRQDSQNARNNQSQGNQNSNRQNQNSQNSNNQNQQGQNQQAQGQQGQNQNRVQQQGNTIRYRIGKLEGGQSRTLTVSAVANDAGQAHSCMWVDFQPTLCTSIDVVQPDFRLVGRLLFDRGIETQGDIEGVYKCDDLKLEMVVTSTGDAATEPAQATVQLPKGVTTQDGKNQVQVDMGRLEPNKSARKEIPLKLDPQQAGDEIKLQANATAGDLKANIQLPGVKVLDPQLKVTVDAPEQAYINKPTEMNVTVENPGQDPVLDAVVRIEGPAGAERFTVEGARAGQDGTIEIGRLNAGESRDFTVNMQANSPMKAAINVSAEGYCAKAEQQKSQIVWKGIPAVLIEVVDKVDPVQVGQDTVYEVSIKNQGTQSDTNIQLSATLPDSMEFLRGDGETKVTAEGKTIRFAPLKEIAPGDVVSWTLQVKAKRADKARLKVELQSDATDEPIIEQEPTTLYGDSPQSDDQAASQQKSGANDSSNSKQNNQ